MPGYELWGDNEKKHLNDVIESGILMRYNFESLRNNHWKAKEFEQAIQKRMKVEHVQLTSSGTTALLTALNAAGIGAGDEVILPTFTFVASFEAVLSVGAIPILVDIDETLTLDPKAVEQAITPRTKVIMPVHMCGAMADLTALKEIAKKHNILLIEDACQSFGATYKGKYLGTIGDLGCFSFDFVKTVTCGEGGAVLTNNKEYYIHTDQYTDHGHDHIGNNRGAENHPNLGLNYRISELHAAVGLAQFERLDEILSIQRENKKILKNALKEIEGISFRKILDEEGDNASFFSIFLTTEELARKASLALSAKGIGNAYWFDNNWHYIKKWDHLKLVKTLAPLYKEHKELLPNYASADYSKSDAVISRTVTIPISLLWTHEEVQKKSNIIKEVLSEILNK
ncbi:DegT/DnrJ/EryC1/StrS family aminotransferase [Apibacter adventoris]|uniref:L-glutamine--2-deoxy-scyllo-inosose aminotransferase KanB n=1 Tax=Apibacter adventoris TaxID=1679466 RepID=A0A2S8AAN8_9FLAO|nr:DegT/DnrJ/EryC1/StrS family aminotransferase [Apibacter adventoris]PQL91649.1 L-glutamine--2-deoxy-scyllo-inosose aminotransferase KanB [Apibacter adventoris]